jgi:hypothetical protein
MIIPNSTTFDQRTMTLLMEHGSLVQSYCAFFALFDWSVVPEPTVEPSQPGKPSHPQSAYVKALLLKIEEGFASCTQLRGFLLSHPLLVLALGFRPKLNRDLPYGFDVTKTVPTEYGDVVLAEYTLPFNENDITCFFPLYIRTVATLGFFPT